MGVIFNEILSRDSEEHNNHSDDNSDQEESVGFKKFMTLFQKVGQQSDVFKMYPTANRVMDIKIVAVKEAFRSQGVCKALFNKTKYVHMHVIIILSNIGISISHPCEAVLVQHYTF